MANSTPNMFLDPPIENVSADDIQLLIRHPEKDVRAGAVQRICRTFRHKDLSDTQRQFALKILNFMANDVAVIVRRALSVTLKNSPNLPRGIALRLAQDIDTIAVPLLENSPVFNDDDLIEVLKSKAAAKVMAVAKRPTVSDHIARAIVRFGDNFAVAEMAANDGAMISEDTASAILSLYADDDLIKQCFISRQDLPVAITEKLITLLSADAVIQLQQRHALSPELVMELAKRTQERTTVDFIDQSWLSRDIQDFVKHLQTERRLDMSLIVRAACCGQMRFVEHALGRIAGIAHTKAALMLHDGGPFGLKSLCARIGVPDSVFYTLRAACAIFRDLENGGLKYDRSHFQSLMLERVLTLPLELSDADQVYFVEKLDRLHILSESDSIG